MKNNKKSKEGINKKIALISLVALFFNATMLGVFVPSESLLQADGGGSVSKCDWWNRELIGPSLQWVLRCDDGNTDSDDGCDSQHFTNGEMTQEWCDGKSLPPNRLSVFTPATNSSISGCKYNDANDDAEITENEKLAGGLPGWEIVLAGDFSANQNTDENGCYSFTGLPEGSYTISEVQRNGWIQTYPPNGSYSVNLEADEDMIDKDFGNYFPTCGNNIIDIGEECDDNNPETCVTQESYDGFKLCENCFWETCQSDEFCGDGAINGNEQCEEDSDCNSGNICQNCQCVIESGPECTDNDEDGYGVGDTTNCPNPKIDCDDENPEINPDATEICGNDIDENCDGQVNEGCENGDDPECTNEDTETCYNGPAETEGVGTCQTGTRICANGVWGECEGEVTPQNEICGNGIDEDCNGADTSCDDPDPDPAPAGGGGALISGLTISNESIRNIEVSEFSMKITWTTNQFSTSQVIYDTEPGKFDIKAGTPNYGYAYSKEGDDSGLEKVTGHSVTLTGLDPAKTYYYRTVSTASPPVFSSEKNFVTLAMGETVNIEEEGIVKGVTDSSEPEPEITPIPTECNYLLEYIKLGADNDPVEVEKLERFLNEFEGEDLEINGIYEHDDFDAVSRFQEKYLKDVLSPWSHSSSTGYVYITTKKKINELYCQKEFPLTKEQENEMALFISSLSNLSSALSEETQDQEDQQSSHTQEEDGEVKDDEDKMTLENEENEENKEDEKAQDDVLIVGESEDEETINSSSIVKEYKDFGSWVWPIILIVIGIVSYFLLSASKRKKEKVG